MGWKDTELGNNLDQQDVIVLENLISNSLWMVNERCGLYYKPMTIVNDDSRVVNKLEASLTDDARVIIYNHHIFIVQATGYICQ
jgi:hypothetical protein